MSVAAQTFLQNDLTPLAGAWGVLNWILSVEKFNTFWVFGKRVRGRRTISNFGLFFKL